MFLLFAPDQGGERHRQLLETHARAGKHRLGFRWWWSYVEVVWRRYGLAGLQQSSGKAQHVYKSLLVIFGQGLEHHTLKGRWDLRVVITEGRWERKQVLAQ